MKSSLLSVAITLLFGASMAQNLQFRDHLSYNGSLANIGGIAINGKEFALVGWSGGLSIVDVTNPDSIFEVINVPDTNSFWREVKTFNNHAYVTNESGQGLQVINLTYLPDSAPSHDYTGDGAIAGQLITIHALHIDNGFAYLYGSNLFQGAAVVVDLNQDAWNPVYVGNSSAADPNYIHDGYVRNDTMYAGHIYNGYFSVIDFTNKANPVLISTQNTPDNFTHNTWLNDAGTVIFTTDEVDKSKLASYDISDLQNIKLLDEFQTIPGANSIVHNTHTLGQYQIVSWYDQGVVIVDASDPSNMVEVGKYITDPLAQPGNFEGCWGVYPYLPSGTIVASDMYTGLYVITPTYVNAAYLNGLVTDSVTGLAIPGANVSIIGTTISKLTDVTGAYKTGYGVNGLYDIVVNKGGYSTKTITGVSLTNGTTTTLNIELAPLISVAVTGNVINAVNGQPVPFADVQFIGPSGEYNLQADAAGAFSLPSILLDAYELSAGKWGFKTTCLQNQQVINGAVFTVQITPGIYDDFTFNNNWTNNSTATQGIWTWGEPLGTFANGFELNPDFDYATDCGNKCMVTGNTGTQIVDDDVAGGYTILESPVFDLRNHYNPFLKLQMWFANFAQQGGVGNDTVKIILSNGSIDTVIRVIHGNNFNFFQWNGYNFILKNYLPLTSTMQLKVYAEEFAPEDLLEVGFDKFEITGITGIEENISAAVLQLYPNPSHDKAMLKYDLKNAIGGNLVITDLSGRVVQSTMLQASMGLMEVGENLAKGIYTIAVSDGGAKSQTIKFVKL
ncbi:MAG: choice-of-anchor B family protein [Bacteroidetes bacterium]|nr:choice-of-anchor B family protein [Bacteroidota bacterium]